MEHDEMVAELISRYPHREEEIKRLDELLVYRDDEGVYGFEFDTCLINEIFIKVAEYDFHTCDEDRLENDFLLEESTFVNEEKMAKKYKVYKNISFIFVVKADSPGQAEQLVADGKVEHSEMSDFNFDVYDIEKE